MSKEENTEEAIIEKKKELPVDLFSDKMPDNEILPLIDEVKTKDYATIPEGATNETEQNLSGDTQPTSDGSQPSNTATTTPTTKPMTEQDKHDQARQTVELFLRGYEKIHGIGRWIGKVDMSELLVLHNKGQIDLNQELPIGSATVLVKDFFNEYNSGIDTSIVVSPDFKEKFTPSAIRECIRRGWYISDLMYCGVLLAEDLTTKMSLLIGFKKTANMVIESCALLMKNKQQKNQ